MIVQGAVVVTLTWALATGWASHFKVLCQRFFYIMGKALSGKLSCTGTGLVDSFPVCEINFKHTGTLSGGINSVLFIFVLLTFTGKNLLFSMGRFLP